MTATTISTRAEIWDRLGCWASGACAIHCLVAPLLFLVLPAFAEVWAHPASHALMALGVVPLALTVLFSGYRKHRLRWVLVATLLGIVCILVGSALPYLPGAEVAAAAAHDAGGAAGACDACCPTLTTDDAGGTSIHLPPAAIATVIGSLLLVAAHLGNHRGCRDCGCEASPRV